MEFASDNAAGVAPAILEAMASANDGFAAGYGDDVVTRRLERRLCELFETRSRGLSGDDRDRRQCIGAGASLAAVGNGDLPCRSRMPWCMNAARRNSTAAACGFSGSTAITASSRRWRSRRRSTSISGSPRTRWCPARCRSPRRANSERSIESTSSRRLLRSSTSAGMMVHMDGARFANALVRLGATPADASWKAGIDVLSFGATKGGALGAEAVVFFDPARAAAMAERRKRGGHLALQAPLRGGAIRGLPAGRSMARACRSRQPHGRSAGGRFDRDRARCRRRRSRPTLFSCCCRRSCTSACRRRALTTT